MAAGDGGRAGYGGETPVGSPMSLPGCRNVPAGRLCAVPAWHAAALIAMTSPTGADRQLRLHVAAGPSCRCLAGTEHRTAPAARADRLNGALGRRIKIGGLNRIVADRLPAREIREGFEASIHWAAALTAIIFVVIIALSLIVPIVFIIVVGVVARRQSIGATPRRYRRPNSHR